ncbi:MAG TPA: DUF5916 domain-containing protein [Gemmatimonadales bacterium]|nr:DUF5916 domain-containing protein [Gemmatimonadales bacterium]
MAVLAPHPAAAQAAPSAQPDAPPPTPSRLPAAASYHITAATGPIAVDGRMDEAAWRDATLIPIQYEWFPGDNVAPPVATNCRVTYDPSNLYVGCRAFDPNPSAIRAHYADRDDLDRTVGDDHIVLLLDTSNDERRAFQFRVNAVGVQMDALLSTAEGFEDFSWDAIWQSAGHIDADGYTVELRIPFRSLRFPESSGEETWGLILERSWPRSARHRMRSAPNDRNNACLLCQANKVTGFAGITPGNNVELYPTLTSHRTDQRDAFPDGPLQSGSVKVDPGLDLRWGVTSNLSLNATANPDFSQVEADVAQLAVNTRFALFFPERRPFFLEGADFFQTPIQAVFTRTVADPTGGLKFSGKWGSAGVGAFAAHDRLTNIVFPSNQGTTDTSLTTNTVTSALRFRQDVGQASYVGALYTGRESFDGYSNRVAGADAFIQLSPANSVRLQALGSETEYPDAVARAFSQPLGRFTGVGLRASYLHADRDWTATLDLDELSPDFRADAGFVPRVDFRDAVASLTRTVFGAPGQPFTQLQFGATGSITTDHTWDVTDHSTGLNAFYLGPAQTSVQLEGYRDFQQLATLGHDFTWGRVTLQSQPWGSAKLGLAVRAGGDVDVANNRTGNTFELTPNAQIYLGRSLSLNVQHDYQRLSVAGERVFTANLLQGRVVYYVGTRIFFRAIAQWEHVDRNTAAYLFTVAPIDKSLFTQLLFSYKLNPQTVAFVGYSDGRFGTDTGRLLQQSRTFFVKLGYALRP